MAQGFTSPGFVRHVAEAYHRAGDIAESIPLYETALRNFPNDVSLMQRLMAAYEESGTQEKAEELRLRIADTQALYNTDQSQ